MTARSGRRNPDQLRTIIQQENRFWGENVLLTLWTHKQTIFSKTPLYEKENKSSFLQILNKEYQIVMKAHCAIFRILPSIPNTIRNAFSHLQNLFEGSGKKPFFLECRHFFKVGSVTFWPGQRFFRDIFISFCSPEQMLSIHIKIVLIDSDFLG